MVLFFTTTKHQRKPVVLLYLGRMFKLKTLHEGRIYGLGVPNKVISEFVLQSRDVMRQEARLSHLVAITRQQ